MICIYKQFRLYTYVYKTGTAINMVYFNLKMTHYGIKYLTKEQVEKVRIISGNAGHNGVY
jgi:hypothetical protein